MCDPYYWTFVRATIVASRLLYLFVNFIKVFFTKSIKMWSLHSYLKWRVCNFAYYKAKKAILVKKIKGSLTRDFRLQVFFVNQCPPGPWLCHYDRFDFFSRKFVEIIENECLSAVSTTPAIKEKYFCEAFCVLLIFRCRQANIGRTV